jgi:hypothetical protein
MMGEPSIFKMKRKAEALAKILPVFCLLLASETYFLFLFFFRYPLGKKPEGI